MDSILTLIPSALAPGTEISWLQNDYNELVNN